MTLELLQFPHSHYNEKVRWTLAYKGLPYHRRDLLPGPHAPTILWLTRQTQTPVMRFDGEVVAGSARIGPFTPRIVSVLPAASGFFQ